MGTFSDLVNESKKKEYKVKVCICLDGFNVEDVITVKEAGKDFAREYVEKVLKKGGVYNYKIKSVK